MLVIRKNLTFDVYYRRLLDKQQRLEAIVASLEQGGADSSQKAEIEEMITPSERAQLAKIKHMTNKYVGTMLRE